MNVLKTFGAAALGAAAFALMAPIVHAQTDVTNPTTGDTVALLAAGSSAQFKPFAIAVKTTVGNGLFTFTGTGYSSDPTTATANDSGPIFIAWTGPDANGHYTVYSALQTDSSVGNRLFYNRGSIDGTSGTSTPVANEPANQPITAAGAQTITGFNDSGDTPLANIPANVITDVTTTPLNAALTDILPADANVATFKALNGNYTNGIAYSESNPFKGYATAAPGETGTAGSGSSLAPVPWPAGPNAISLGSEVITPVGVDPVVVIVNNTSTGAGHLGNNAASEIGRFTLARFLTGATSYTSDIIQTSGLGANEKIQVPVFIREALSGTYNTMEYSVPASTEVGSSQENGVTANPQDAPYFKRAIGTGNEVKAVSATTDALGYAFYGLGNFKGFNVKYITVDGVDPLFPTYTPGGNLQGISPTFDNIVNGSYPIWSNLRLVTAATLSSDLSTVVSNVTSNDFLSPNALRVIRSHHNAAGETAHNGDNTLAARAANGNSLPNGRRAGKTESGGDVGGAIFPINTDQNVYDLTGNEITGINQ